MIGTITLNPSIDQHMLVERLDKDDTNRAKEIIETPGGKGINVSKVVRELEGKTRAYAMLGGLTGERLKELIKPLDFPLVALSIKGNTRINTVLTDLRDHTQTRISAPGPVISARELKRFLQLLSSAPRRPNFWALGGSLSQGMKSSTYRDFIWVLQKKGTPCILDTDNAALRLGIDAAPYMIKPNEYEMERLCGKRLRALEDYLAAAEGVVRRGVKLVIVSLGAKGALFVTPKSAFHALAPPVKVKNKVGAGDALIGGVLLALHQKASLEEAAKIGIAASVSAVMREAPRFCLRSDIQKLIRRVKIRRF
jgi:1-phosphofructokinase family hexose kinase